jgi:hypothetical protein
MALQHPQPLGTCHVCRPTFFPHLFLFLRACFSLAFVGVRVNVDLRGTQIKAFSRGMMLYTQKTFSVPTTSQPMTDSQYELAVGLRCPDWRLMYAAGIHLVSAVCECQQNRNE